MNFKTTILLACSAIGVCAGYVMWRDRTPRPANATTTTTATRLVALAEDATIERVEYTPRNAATMVFVRAGERWNLTAPQSCRATSWMVNELIIAMKGLEVVAEHDLAATDSPALEEAGIAPQPVARIALATVEGARFEVLIGKPLLSSSTTYAYKPDDAERLSVVSLDFTEILERGPMQYRDHRLFDFTAESAVGVSVIDHTAGGETRCTLERRADGWWFSAPFDARADDARIDAMVSGAERLWVRGWVEEPDGTLADYGLAPPALEVHITCTVKGTTQTSSLLIAQQGPLTDDKQVYVARGGQTLVGTIGVSDMAQFEPQPDQWRDLDLIRQSLDSVLSMTIANENGTLTITRQDDAWLIASTQEPAHDAAIDAILQTLADLAAVSLIDNSTAAPLEEIVATVTLQFADGDPIVLRIGPYTDTTARRLRFAQVSARLMTAKIRTDDAAFALRPIATYYDPFIVNDTPQRVQRIAIDRRIAVAPERQAFALERTDLNLWTMTAPPLGDVRQDRAQALAAALATLQGIRVLEPSATLVAQWPDPDASASLTFEAPEVIHSGTDAPTAQATTIEIEVLHTDDHTWARRRDSAHLYEISPATYDTLMSEVMRERLWDLAPPQVQSVSWGSLEAVVTLERDGRSWRSADAPDLPLDQDKVNAHVAGLCTLTASRYVAYDGADLARYGLDEPAYTLVLRLQDGGTRTLQIAEAQVAGARHYAAPDDGSRVCLVSAVAIERCTLALSDLE